MKSLRVRSADELHQALQRHLEAAAQAPGREARGLKLEMLVDGIPVEIRLTEAGALLIGYLGRQEHLGGDAMVRAGQLALGNPGGDAAGLACDESGCLSLTRPLRQADAPGLLAALNALVGQAVRWVETLACRQATPTTPGHGWQNRWKPV